MINVLHQWLYQDEEAAVEALRYFDLPTRERMAAEAKTFAEWIAQENFTARCEHQPPKALEHAQEWTAENREALEE